MKYSEADRIASIGNDDLVALGHEDSQGATGYLSGVSTVKQIGDKINNSIEYSTDLETTDKTIIGAINEVAQGGGGSVDITTEITTPAPIMTFNDGGNNIPLKSLVTEIVPIQAGSGTPSPSNVRAISGHSSVNVFNSGKNLIFTLYQSSSQLILINATSIYTGTLKKGTYTFSANISHACSLNYRKSADDSSVNIATFLTTGNISTTFTIAEDLYNCNFFLFSSQGVSVSDISNAQLELNDEATTYEAYKGTTHTITLPETIYGGSLECVEGSGQITKAYVEFDGSSDETWYQAENGAFYIRAFVDTTWQTSKICNMYQYGGEVSSSAGVTQDKTFYAQYSQSSPQYCRLWVKDTDYETVTAFTTFLASNTLQVVYGLKTPTSLSVSGANIPTLSGVNNVYTDCGDIQSLEYFNNKANDIDSLVNLENRLSGRIRTKTYTGDGSIPLVVNFDEVPTMILNIFGNGQNSQVITFPFVYGLDSFGGVYVTPNPWTSPTQAGGGHLLYKVAYSNGGKTMTIRASANDAGAHFNQSGDTYTIYYLV